MSGVDSLPRRLNGRPAACDPCRARKVACDHSRPTCKRCRNRKQASECVYSGPSGASKSPNRVTRSRAAPIADAVVGSAEAVDSELRQEAVPPLRPVPAILDRGPRYFGFTSHSTVLQETSNSLSLLNHSETRRTETDIDAEPRQVSISFGALPLPLRETCLLVLRCLPGQSNEQIVFHENHPATNGWAYVAVDRIVRSIQELFGERLSRGQFGLEAVAEMLCRNTAKPLREHDDPQEWLDQFTGDNLRWESLGLLWAHLARVSDILDALGSRRLDWISGRESLETARTSLGYCIDISRHFAQGNDLLLDICRRKGALDTIIDGDAGISSWVSHSRTIAMLTSLGLHALENDELYEPTLCSEYKRRLVAQIFASDKLGVAFTGRPPLISRRYCSTPLPLDFRDEDLAADQATLKRASQSLDAKGWNTDGGLYPISVIRARCIFAFVRDEIVEVALDKRVYATIDQLLGIKDREIATMTEFPSGLIYHPEDLTAPMIDTKTLYIRILIMLEHLQNMFLIERLLLRHGHPNNGELLITSYAMVTLTLKFWTHKDRFPDVYMRRHFEWLFLSYGVPGGGILCQELLHPTFSGMHPKDPNVTRSSIIQQVSLLVGSLDWVRPSAPNGDLCADSKNTMQRVLDHHLNSLGTQTEVPEAMDWNYLNQPDFNFELLDTFDWLRTDAQ